MAQSTTVPSIKIEGNAANKKIPKLQINTAMRPNHFSGVFVPAFPKGVKVDNTAAMRGIRVEITISLPSPISGSNGTGRIAPQAEPAMDEK